MTENRKRVSVSVRRGGRTVSVAAARHEATRTVSVAALPVRGIDTAEAYDGSYEVDPDWMEQTLQTSGKRMENDVTVNAIYKAETSNPAGGITIFIGPDN